MIDMPSQTDNTNIYIVTHKDFAQPNLKNYIPILAGADNNYANIAVRDNIGDHISSKNPEYCELTAQYWVWKNAIDQAQNFGFVHYRRYFYTTHTKRQIVPAAQFTHDLQAGVDVILPEPWVLTKTVREQWAQFHDIHDLQTTRAILREHYPEYVAAFDELLKGHALCTYNMFVMPKQYFDEYMTWLFDVLHYAEQQIDTTQYDSYNQRLFGFLSERLLNVWVQTRGLRVKYYPVYKPDDSWFTENTRNAVKSLIYGHRK